MRTYKTAEAAAIIGIHPNTVRFYEEWGLITKPEREKNGYRVYTDEDIRRLKIIRSLRCANYSLEAILRMLQQLSQNPNTDIREALNTPRQKEDIISACDKLLVSLEAEETVLRRDREYKETKQYMVDYRNEMDGHEKLQTERLRFKSSLAFVERMEDYVAHLADRVFEAKDYCYDGQTVSAEWIRERFSVSAKLPVKKRLTSVAEDIRSKLRTGMSMGGRAAKNKSNSERIEQNAENQKSAGIV